MDMPSPREGTQAVTGLNGYWNEMRETVQMLGLAVAQIEHSMSQGEDSVQALLDSFLGIAALMDDISAAASHRCGANTECEGSTPMLSRSREAATRVRQAIVAFQFYDRLSQRLAHCAEMLTAVGDLVTDAGRRDSPHEWRSLQGRIVERYTMREERALFDAVLRGVPPAEAARLARNKPQAGLADDVELF